VIENRIVIIYQLLFNAFFVYSIAFFEAEARVLGYTVGVGND